MAVKTFQTRIKLKYDSSTNWSSFTSALPGEILLGSDDKYIRIGKENGSWDWAKMSADNVNLNIEGVAGENVKEIITSIKGLVDGITGGGVVTSFGGQQGAITLNDNSGLTIGTDNILSINTPSADNFGVVKVTTGNGLSISEGVISLGLASTSTAGAMSSTDKGKLDSALQSVNVTDNNNFVKLSTTGSNPNSPNIHLVTTTITLENANEQDDGLATAYDVKSHVDGINGILNTKASQDDLAALTGRVSTAEEKITTLEGKAINNTQGDDWVSVGLENNKLTVGHKDVEKTENNGSGVTVGSGTEITTFNIPNLTFDNKGHVTNFGTTTITVKTPSASDLGVSAALKFIGVTTSNVTNGSSEGSVLINEETVTAKEGNVVIKGDLEFAWDGGKWVELGNASKVAQDLADLTTRVDTNKDAITTLNGDVNQTGSVAHSINSAIQLLDSVVSAEQAPQGTTPNGDFKVLEKVDIKDGKLVPTDSAAVTLKKLAATGAAADVTIADTVSKFNATTVEGALTELATNIETLTTNVGTQITTAIEALNTGETIASESEGVVTLSQTITQTNGVIDINGDETNKITFAKAATTGKISDLEQAASTESDGKTNTVDMIIFDCGSATKNTLN